MRVTTNMIYDCGVASIQSLWSKSLHTQQEVSTGRRVLTPADDPIAAARALDVNQSRSVNAQYRVNLGYSTDALKLVENKLVGMEDIYQYMRVNAIAAGDGIYTQDQLDILALDMRSQFDSLLSLSNTRDASGDYLFSGYRADVQPFQGSFGDVTYEGDQGSRTMQVSSSRFMPVSFPGSQLLDNTRPTEGAARVFAGNGNSSGVSATVSFNPAQPAAGDIGRRYDVSYDGTNYNVVEYVPGNAAPTPVGSFPGPVINSNGIELTVTGTPVAGDSFEIFVASKNVFENLALFVDSLEHPGSSGVISGVSFALENIDFALDASLRVRAQIGSQLVEVEQLENLGEEMDGQYASTLSRLQDCDYAEAYSRLTQLQTNLEAAQLSFMKVSGLSLFNYLS